MRRHDPACLRSSDGKITPVGAIRKPDPQSAVRLDLMPDGWRRAICSVTLAQKQTAAAPQRGTAQQSSSPVSSAPASTDIKGARSNCKPVSSPVGAKGCSKIILLYVRNLWTVKEVPRIERRCCGYIRRRPRDKPFRFNPPDARSSPDYIRSSKRQVCLCPRRGPSGRSSHLGSR
jgi:hypothetical protein